MLKRFAHLSFWLGASLYFGGLVALGAIAAPAIFYVTNHTPITMPDIAPSLNMGNQVGGEIFGEVLNRFVWIEVISMALLLFGIGVPLLAHRPIRRSTSLLFSLWLALAILLGYTAIFLHPQIWHMRDVVRASAATRPAPATGLSVEARSSPWPEKEAFDALHARAETLARIKAYLLLAMIVIGAVRGITEPRVSAEKRVSSAGAA